MSAVMTDTREHDLEEVIGKFDLLETTLNSELKERPEQIHGFVLALASGTHIYLHGEPGLGKTLLAERGMAYISGARMFKTQVGPLSALEQVLGPLDVPAMLDSRYRRHNDLYLPKSHVGLVDEGFDAGPALLVGLNRLMNEGEYEDDGRMMPADTSTVVVCSNEWPSGPRVRAFYDRLLQRFETLEILETQPFIDAIRDEFDPDPKPILDWSEIEYMKSVVAAMPVPDAVWNKLGDLRRRVTEELRRTPSTRRFKQSVKLMRAEAALEGASKVAIEHISVCTNTLWDQQGEAERVSQVILAMADPIQQQLNQLLRAIDGISPDLDASISMPKDTDTQHEQRENACMDVYDKITRANGELAKLLTQAGDGKRHGATVAYARKRLHQAVVRLMLEGFEHPPEDLEKLDLGVA